MDADDLVLQNLKLVKYLAIMYQGRGVLSLDLIQSGYIGLIESSRTYSGKCAFSSWASTNIRWKMEREIRVNGGLIRIPDYMSPLIYELMIEEEKLVHELHRKPTVVELAEYVKISCRDVRRIQRCQLLYSSIDEVDLAVPDKNESPKFYPDLFEALNKLKFEQREVLILHFGLYDNDVCQDAKIARIFHMSRECIRQIKLKALRRLRKMLSFMETEF